MRQGRRVAVVGLGAFTPLGNTPQAMLEALYAGVSGIRAVPHWAQVEGLKTLVAGEVDLAGREGELPRKLRRSLARVGLLAALSARDAVADAGLAPADLASPRAGVSFGSTSGGTADMELFIKTIYANQSVKGILSSHYLKCMSHTCAANLAVMFGTQGPMVASCTACTSGSQGVGYGYQAIRWGQAELMVTGGAEEGHLMNGAIFDLMQATSTRYNHQPHLTPRPFDAARDGLVVAEGGGVLILEEWDHARARGARIYAEVVGFGNTTSGTHLTNSDAGGIAACMLAALADAGLTPGDVGYVSAHATATQVGDQAEAEATSRVFGEKTPVSGQKGHMGHTLGASGALESIAVILMGRAGRLAPTRNLDNPDPALPPLDHLVGACRATGTDTVMNNNFAFGGVNTSLIFRLV
ncbi:MAG: beta-ketoacyl-ACP synthase [Deltaproteobacteria bacterium]|nr:beta-ketoacyl-ACP synthase [Deltaproteobacteria bacterium]